LTDVLQKRLASLSRSLGDKPYLDGDRFTAGDLMMATVLRILSDTDIVTGDSRLAAYVERCTGRPASSAPSTRRWETSGRRLERRRGVRHLAQHRA
jgi:glutathione S-transferase